jgi:hypothetical protein
METIPFTIASKKKKEQNLGINLTMEVKDLCNENYKILQKRLKKTLKY